MSACNTCGTANDEAARICSHCGSDLRPAAVATPPSGAAPVAAGLFTGLGIAVVYVFVEAFLSLGFAGATVGGRLCLGPALAIGWSILVLVGLVYALFNRPINETLGRSYVAAAAITGLALVALPLTLCTNTAAPHVFKCVPGQML
jgi:hypothetical protein